VRLHMRCCRRPSTGPSARDQAVELAPGERLQVDALHSPSFHSATTASGTSSPLRTWPGSAPRPDGQLVGEAAEASSRAWASSMTSTSGRPGVSPCSASPARERMARRRRAGTGGVLDGRSGRRHPGERGGRSGGADAQHRRSRRRTRRPPRQQAVLPTPASTANTTPCPAARRRRRGAARAPGDERPAKVHSLPHLRPVAPLVPSAQTIGPARGLRTRAPART
jgi:hypothetical protein